MTEWVEHLSDLPANYGSLLALIRIMGLVHVWKGSGGIICHCELLPMRVDDIVFAGAEIDAARKEG